MANQPHPFLATLLTDHTAPATDYAISAGTENGVYNCFAYAVGVNDRRLLPYSYQQLRDAYAAEGYYEVDLDDDIQNGDVEVYARTNLQPLHAHRVVVAHPGNIDHSVCSSKMGQNVIIQHLRRSLCSPRPGAAANTYTYGQIRWRFRRDLGTYAFFKDKEVKTSSGRKTKGSEVRWDTDGNIHERKSLGVTRSGTVYNKDAKTVPAKGAKNNTNIYAIAGPQHDMLYKKYKADKKAAAAALLAKQKTTTVKKTTVRR